MQFGLFPILTKEPFIIIAFFSQIHLQEEKGWVGKGPRRIRRRKKSNFGDLITKLLLKFLLWPWLYLLEPEPRWKFDERTEQYHWLPDTQIYTIITWQLKPHHDVLMCEEVPSNGLYQNTPLCSHIPVALPWGNCIICSFTVCRSWAYSFWGLSG